MSSPQLLLTFLSLTSSSLSGIIKFPQIIAIVRRRTVSGINRNSLLIECWNNMMTISYSAHFGYPVRNYAEFGLLIAQNFVILFLVVHWSKQSFFPSNGTMLAIVTSSVLIHSLIAFHLVPSYVPVALITTGLPSGIISRLMQIQTIVRNKDSGSLSAATWAIATVTTFCRFLTNWLTVRDAILLFRVGSGCSLNAILCLTILAYRKDKNKTS